MCTDRINARATGITAYTIPQQLSALTLTIPFCGNAGELIKYICEKPLLHNSFHMYLNA
jgi:hypothetical protein